MNQSFLKTAKRIVLGLLAIVLTGGLALITVIAKPREQIFHNRHMSDTPATRKARIRAFITKHLCITMLAIGLMGFFAMIAIMAKPLDPVKRAISDFSFTDIYYNITIRDSKAPEDKNEVGRVCIAVAKESKLNVYANFNSQWAEMRTHIYKYYIEKRLGLFVEQAEEADSIDSFEL